MPYSLILQFLIIIIILLPNIKYLKENERLVIFRLGVYWGIKGPGLVITIPFVEKKTKISLDKIIPGWQGLSTDELNKKIREYALANMD
jgi:regulator of protease activity HflC (stomatin/prohibitin superfamily)